MQSTTGARPLADLTVKVTGCGRWSNLFNLHSIGPGWSAVCLLDSPSDMTLLRRNRSIFHAQQSASPAIRAVS